MGTFWIWALFAVFGGICALYVSVIGFALSALAIVTLLGLMNPIFDGIFGLRMLVVAFVVLQVGYFVGLIGKALVAHVARLSTKDPRRVDERGLHIEHD